jgi:hypothetical protein
MHEKCEDNPTSGRYLNSRDVKLGVILWRSSFYNSEYFLRNISDKIIIGKFYLNFL